MKMYDKEMASESLEYKIGYSHGVVDGGKPSDAEVLLYLVCQWVSDGGYFYDRKVGKVLFEVVDGLEKWWEDNR